MIPANHPYEAHYKATGHDGKTYHESRPVIAWDENGFPLIAGRDRLVRADHRPGFHGVEEARGPVIAALPSGGYRIAYKQDDGAEDISSVLGWLIYADGWAEAIDSDADGWVDTVSDTANARLIPPDIP